MSDGPAGPPVTAEIATIGAADCRCVAFSPDGSALALVAGGQLMFCEYPGRMVWSVPCELDQSGPMDVVWGLGAERLYVLGHGTLTGYEFEWGSAVALPDILTSYGALSSVAAAPDGRFVVAGTATGPVLVLDEPTQAVLVLRGTDPTTALCWRPDGSELCVARGDILEFWDVADQAMLASVHLPEVQVDRLAWSPDGELLAAAGESGVHQIRVRTLHDRTVTAHWPGSGPVVSAQFSRSGRQLLIGLRDGSVVTASRALRPLSAVPANIASPGTLAISSTGLLAIRTSPAAVGLMELPDTVPGHGWAMAAGRRWAARHGRTVGRRGLPAASYVAGPVRPTVLPASQPVTAFAWWPDGRSACLATADGTLARIRPPSVQALWSRALPGVSQIAVSHHGLIAAAHPDGVTVLDGEGTVLATLAGAGPLAWSPPGVAEPALAVTEPAGAAAGERAVPRRVLILQPGAPDRPGRRLAMPDGVAALSWSPHGPVLAAAGRGHVVLWDTRTGRRDPAPLPAGSSRQLTGPLAWSADGRRLAALARGDRGDRTAGVRVWNTANWNMVRELPVPSRAGRPPLAWSPDNRVLAIVTGGPGGTGVPRDQVELWDVLTGQRLAVLSRPEISQVTALSWSPDGDTIAVTYADGVAVLWDVVGTTLPDAGDAAELPFDREVLVKLACAATDAGAAAPLGQLTGLLGLVGGDPPEELIGVAAHRGVAALHGLGWPLDARIGLAALLAADLPRDPVYLAPADATRDDLAMALRQVLAGAACPVRQVPLPLVELAGLLDGVTDRLMTLLDLLGPDAVAAEPSLPARLRQLRDELTPLTASQRRLLGVRVPLAGEGGSEGGTGGQGRAGVARHGRIDALLLSQLALPRQMFAIRHARDELLYRTRSGSPPPAPRAAVLVLDDTAAAHGQVGVTLRLIAHLIATTVIRDGHRCALVMLGAPATDVVLSRPEDVIRIWTAGTDAPPDSDAGARLAEGLVAQLAMVHGGDTRVILLTHPYQPPLPYPGSVTVRVHYRGQPVTSDDPLCVVVSPEPTAADLIGAVSRLIS